MLPITQYKNGGSIITNKDNRIEKIPISSTSNDRMYNTKLLDEKNKDRLFYSCTNIIIMVGLCIDVVNFIIENKKNLSMFRKESINGIVCMKVLKKIMVKHTEK